MQDDGEQVRIAVVQEAWRRYVDGAATYVEFVRRAASLVTREDCVDHNESVRQLPEHVARWPFEG